TVALAAVVGAGGCQRAADNGAGQPPSSPTLRPIARAAAAAIVHPGPPGQASSAVSSVPTFTDSPFTDADVKFMQGMIHHHNQALQMAAMIPTHTKTPQLQAMGQKITISQSGEIKSMTTWLTTRKQEVPMLHADGSA